MDGSTDTARGAAVGIVGELRRAGHTAYLAGGCVRDALLGVEPKDYDVATDALPEVVRKLFRRSRYVGEAFGVVLVHVGKGAGTNPAGIEVATFRTEWGYEDGRRPGGVEFSDAQHDAQRRDFTINGLFADPLDENLTPLPGGKDRVIDYVEGLADLKEKRLRAIGDPFERFGEDYLRMLRAARFASRLGFTIDPATVEAIRASANKLDKISRERIGQEVYLMLTGPKPASAAGLIQSLRLDGPTLGESHRDTPLRALHTVDTKGGSDYALNLAAWMLDRHGGSGSLSDAAAFVQGESKRVLRGWRKALCLSNHDRDALGRLLALLPEAHNWAELGIARRKRLLASPGWRGAFELVRAVGPAERVEKIQTESAPLLDEGVGPARWVNGDDLIEMGLKAGPGLGEMLERVYDAQLDGRVGSREEAIAWVRERCD